MPTGGQWPGLSFTIADDTAGQQIGIIKDRAVGVHYGIAKFSSLMNRAGCFRSNMAWDTAGKRKLFEEPFHPFFVLRNVRIKLTVGSLQISIRNQPWSAMAWSGDVDHIQIKHLNETVEMYVDEVKPRSRAPVTKQSGFYMCELQWFAQE